MSDLTDSRAKVKYQVIGARGNMSLGVDVELKPFEPSEWACKRFGAAARDLQVLVPQAVHAGHDDALAAHFASGMDSNDAYGATMRVRACEEMISRTREVDGIATRKPEGVRSRFPLIVVKETAVGLQLWRFGSEPRARHEDAQLRRPVSDLRKTTFALSAASAPLQATLLDFIDSDSDMETQWAEDDEWREQSAQLGSVVTIGVCSGPQGVFELGWGDAEILDTSTGAVVWHYWEALPTSAAEDASGVRPVLQEVVATRPRFDDLPTDDEFNLIARPRIEEAPISEPAPAHTGTDSAGNDEH